MLFFLCDAPFDQLVCAQRSNTRAGNNLFVIFEDNSSTSRDSNREETREGDGERGRKSRVGIAKTSDVDECWRRIPLIFSHRTVPWTMRTFPLPRPKCSLPLFSAPRRDSSSSLFSLSSSSSCVRHSFFSHTYTCILALERSSRLRSCGPRGTHQE